MFEFSALLKLINTNNDKIIQKTEMEEFLKTQDKSVFTEYFESITEDTNINVFEGNIRHIIDEQYRNNNIDFDLNFKSQEVKQKYEQIKFIKMLQDENYSSCGYKFNSEEEYNNTFQEALHEVLSNYPDGINMEDLDCLEKIWNEIGDLIETRYTLKNPVDWMARLNTGKFYSSGPFFQNIVFEDVDLSEYSEAFKHITFNENTFAKVSPKHLPPGFNPKEIFEKGKTIGLGIDKAHANGYTGEGVSYAIIDSGTLDDNSMQHNDIHFKEYNVSQYANQKIINHFHGRAVSYIAQEIAPNADCYYYATQNGDGMDAPVLDNLKQILEKNKTLPDNQKIRFVSMSMPLYGGEEAKQVAAELEEQGVWVYYSGCPEDENRSYLVKKNPNGNPDDYSNYSPMFGTNENTLYVNSGDRTVPDPSSPTAYRHDSMASQSWSIPVIAGYYTLACQADSTMTKERFMELAYRTAHVEQIPETKYECTNGDCSKEENWAPAETGGTVDIKIIDINALLQAIETEKLQQEQ